MLKQMVFFLGGLLVLPLATGLSVSATADTVAVETAHSDAASDVAASDVAASDVAASDVAASDVAASDVAASDAAASDAAVSEAAAVRGGNGREAETAAAAVGDKTGLRALPDRLADPEVELESGRKAVDALTCLRRQLSVKMGLPDEFIQLRSYANNVQTLALHNPFTHKDGVLFDVHQHTVGSSVIRLYANGTTLSRVWRNLPAACR